MRHTTGFDKFQVPQLGLRR